MRLIADWMKRAIMSRDDDKKLAEIKKEVVEFSKKFPLPSDS